MKKLIEIVLAIIIFVGAPSTVMAASWSREAEISLTAKTLKINVGETLKLTAVTQKHSSTYTDGWNGAQKLSTLYDNSCDSYISTAEFLAKEPGVYTITYYIYMKAGSGKLQSSGIATQTIEVISPVTPVSAEVRDLSIINRLVRPDGNMAGYFAIGNVYVIWSDGSATLDSSTCIFFRPEEMSKSVEVSVSIEGKQYTYTVNARAPLEN
ncbi:MAG: hypothetical protein N3B21_01125 [Clostridia bacterium]|nr:hypothetical protein [Clostridia bacterium]